MNVFCMNDQTDTNNARIAGLLDNSRAFTNPFDPLYVVRIAQGLLHMGKGLVTLNPFHSDNLLMSNTSCGCSHFSSPRSI